MYWSSQFLIIQINPMIQNERIAQNNFAGIESIQSTQWPIEVEWIQIDSFK